MKNSKISVITVTYNCQDELQSTINSIKSQTYKDIEYIIIDGESTDSTLDIIKKNKSEIDVFISERDNGIYDAMNKGIDLSSGDYIIFMNAGDSFYDRDVLQSFVNNVLSDSDVIYGDHWVLGSKRSDGYHKAKPIGMIKFGMVCCHQSIIYKREVLVQNKFSLNYGTAGDFEHLCRLYSKGFLFQRTKVIFSYYKAGGVSDNKRKQSILYSFIAVCDHNMNGFLANTFFLLRFLLVLMRK